MTKPIPRGLLYGLFALSGFAGLIYESIWSHYLKLMLGHAAYAQTLVLMIFMGGMALGSWLTGRFSQQVPRPLLWYAGIEALLGVAALLFDGVFRLMQGWLFDSVIPGLDAGWTIDAVKWTAAVALTLPQAIMLGATFPLMSAGLLRLHPEAPGSSLSWLYFTNSLGASIGVLASGFYLVGKVGLPGTILTAGLVNFALAGAVYLSERVTGFAPTPALQPQPGSSSVIPAAVRAMLLTAFLTGAASFLYEIGWIRMLSLVLGSATHSFELMLSAFILGLALGSFYIRKKIDASGDPLRLLGWIQVVMALLALLSLPLYMQTFDLMGAAIKALARSEQGYLGFTLFSHLICLVLMLPVTFCAGMTLPLITAVLLRGGHGEGSIGRVYAANTLGAIVGVLLAVHVVMPLLGLRMVVVVGALVDLGLGLWLLARAGGTMARPAQLALTAALVLAAGLSLLTRLDPQVTSSGVFRHGASPGGQVIFHRDGKTATVDVKRDKSGATSISTNGKVDAALSPVEVTSDDYTMALAALLPLSMRPEAKDVGVIGMGSGRTTHAFLLNPKLDRVDTVEIEPAMIEGAQLFGADVALGFSDPRSHLLIEDAKTHFARHRRQYDIIISEPSNPWVSGVATLFSTEFYRQIKNYIKPDGRFVQWVQLYEIDVPLISTIFNALGKEFVDYRVYFTNHTDILIVASKDGPLPVLNDWALKDPSFQSITDRLAIRKPVDIEQRLVGSARTLAPYFSSFGMPANSDYFPVLDQGAAARRFMGKNAWEIGSVQPYSSRLESRGEWELPSRAVEGLSYSRALWQAVALDRYYRSGSTEALAGPAASMLWGVMDDLGPVGAACQPAALEANWLPALKLTVERYGPYLSREAGERIAAGTLSACASAASGSGQTWLALLRAQTARDWAAQRVHAEALLQAEGPQSPLARFLLAEALLGALRSEGGQGAMQLLSRFEAYPRDTPALRYLLSNIR